MGNSVSEGSYQSEWSEEGAVDLCFDYCPLNPNCIDGRKGVVPTCLMFSVIFTIPICHPVFI